MDGLTILGLVFWIAGVGATILAMLADWHYSKKMVAALRENPDDPNVDRYIMIDKITTWLVAFLTLAVTWWGGIILADILG